ncbi:MAG: TIR domain-containing protein [Bacteroidota bacterium]
MSSRRSTDIFLSYSSEDREFAKDFANALADQGIHVWWDREEIPLGANLTTYVAEKLNEARLVVVVWSPISIGSEFVINEAVHALKQSRLIPVIIRNVTPPEPFDKIQSAKLTKTQGFEKVLHTIRQRLEEDDIDIATSTRNLKEEERRIRERNNNFFYENRQSEIRLDHFELQGAEFFGDISWSLNPNVNILLGRNGYGKTFLLKTLIGLAQYNDIVGNGALKEGSAALNLTINDEAREVVFSDSYFDESTVVGQLPILAIPDARFLDRSDTALGPVQFGEIDQSDRYDLTSIGAWHFINEQPFDSMIQSFLYGICLDYYQYDRSFNTESFKLIQKVAQELTDQSFEFDSVRRSGRNKYTLYVKTEGNEDDPVPIQKASQGTVSIIAIVGLIFDFLNSLRPPDKGKVTDRSGIVIIDEIDAHLHPLWQQKVVSLLRKQFPNVQFILSAHNPIVVAGCLEDEVTVLGKRKSSPGISKSAKSNATDDVASPFFLTTFPHDFIGWEADEIYKTVFNIENPDDTFLEYKAILPFRKNIEADIRRLSEKKDLSEKEEEQLNELEEQLIYIEKVNERDRKQMNQAKMEHEIQQLKRQIKQQENSEQGTYIRNLKDENEKKSEKLETQIKILTEKNAKKTLQVRFLLLALVVFLALLAITYFSMYKG